MSLYLQEILTNQVLKVGDAIEILFRNEESKVATGVVGNIDQPTGTISLNNLTLQSGITQLPDPNREYDLRRVINRSNQHKYRFRIWK